MRGAIGSRAESELRREEEQPIGFENVGKRRGAEEEVLRGCWNRRMSGENEEAICGGLLLTNAPNDIISVLENANGRR